MRYFKSRRVWLLALLVILTISGWAFDNLQVRGEDSYAAVNRSIDTFGDVYKHIINSYVKDVDPEEIILASISGMMGKLDPYSEFLKAEAWNQLKIDTTGKFGGLGITIAVKDKVPIVIAPLEGYPAERAGLMAGDRITKIEGESTFGKNIDEVVAKLRGDPGTKVTITVEREGQEGSVDYTITREEIEVKSVMLADVLEDGIGYVRLRNFSQVVGDELEKALGKLKARNIRAIILDLRGNPGGLLSEAIVVSEKFLKKGQLIVSTRGREEDQTKLYRSEEEPIISNLPLVVLVDQGSASASEIVAGAVQDSDRGLVIGETTWGKGSVQTLYTVGEASSRGSKKQAALKLTTAFYYTPSGRCIHREEPSMTIPSFDEEGLEEIQKKSPEDSVNDVSKKQQFKTSNGRIVYGGGGIVPDVITKREKFSPIIFELERRRMFFDFAIHYRTTHKEIPKDFEITDDIIAEFRKFIFDPAKKFDYEIPGESKVKDLEKIAESQKYNSTIKQTLAQLSKELEAEKDRDFDRNRDYIRMALRREIASAAWGSEARIRATFPEDIQLRTALDLLKNPTLYAEKMKGTTVAVGKTDKTQKNQPSTSVTTPKTKN